MVFRINQFNGVITRPL